MDLYLTTEGDLQVGADGDLQLAYGDEEIAQQVVYRLKTQRGDCVVSPGEGASLEAFIGQPNDGPTLAALEQRVVGEITRDRLVVNPSVSAVPTGPNAVLIVVEFRSVEQAGRIIQITAGLSMKEGLVYTRSDSRDDF